MKISRTFAPHDSLVDLIKEDFNILPILSRFSIPLGFGGATIDEVCRQGEIDTSIFLLVVNFLLSGHINSRLPKGKAALGIVDFLHNSHDYFLTYKFPHIRTNLVNALDDIHQDINPSILKFFDDYVLQVQHHFQHEENTVFPYVRQLAAGRLSDEYDISVFSKNHEDIDEKLSDLKNIIMRYYKTWEPNKMYDVLVDIYNLEDDLESHTEIENHILVPMAKALEQTNKRGHRKS